MKFLNLRDRINRATNKHPIHFHQSPPSTTRFSFRRLLTFSFEMASTRISLAEIFGSISGPVNPSQSTSSPSQNTITRAKEVNYYSPPHWYNSDTDDIHLALSAVEDTSDLLANALKPASFAPLRFKVSLAFDKQFADMIYGSNSLEGAGLSEKMTWELVKGYVEGQYPTPNKKLDDETGKYMEQKTSEVIQHIKAFLFLKHLVAETKELNKATLLKAHEILTEGVINNDYYRGVLRNEVTDNLKTGFSPDEIPLHNRPLATQLLPGLIQTWIKEYTDALEASYPSRRDIFVVASNLQYKFLLAHPFYDGNGRMARMLTNILVSQHLPYALIPYGYTKITKRNYKSSVKSTIKKGNAGVMAYDSLRTAVEAASDILDLIGDLMADEELEEEVWNKEVGAFMEKAMTLRAKFNMFFNPDGDSALELEG